MWVSNPYVHFGYSPLTIFEHTQEKALGSKNYDLVNGKTKVSDQQNESCSMNLKQILDQQKQ